MACPSPYPLPALRGEGTSSDDFKGILLKSEMRPSLISTRPRASGFANGGL
jgi:hypothetical protein